MAAFRERRRARAGRLHPCRVVRSWRCASVSNETVQRRNLWENDGSPEAREESLESRARRDDEEGIIVGNAAAGRDDGDDRSIHHTS